MGGGKLCMVVVVIGMGGPSEPRGVGPAGRPPRGSPPRPSASPLAPPAPWRWPPSARAPHHRRSPPPGPSVTSSRGATLPWGPYCLRVMIHGEGLPAQLAQTADVGRPGPPPRPVQTLCTATEGLLASWDSPQGRYNRYNPSVQPGSKHLP